MLIRTLTGLIGLVLFFVILFMDAIVFDIAIYIVTAVMLFETFKATKPGKALIISGIISFALIVIGKLTNDVLPMIVISFIIYAIMCVVLHQKKKYTEVLASAFITLYITIFMSTACDVRRDFNIYGIIMVFLCAWMTDTAAYFSGRFFGKHKLIERVSPKKTVEGAIGGVITTAVSSVVYAYILVKLNVIDTTWITYVMFASLGLLGSVLSQFGDLFASAIKRDCEIKDFGAIFPGHGGMLDRFDSVVFIMPFIYYFMDYFNMMRL